MATIVEIRGGGDEFSHRDELPPENIEIDYSPQAKGAVALKGWAHNIVFGPTLKSVVRPDSVRTLPFAFDDLEVN